MKNKKNITTSKTSTKTNTKTNAKTNAKTNSGTASKTASKKRMSEIIEEVDVKKNEFEGNPDYRRLGKDFFVLNDTHVTKLNNNDLIVGASGRGKTTGYVDPLLDQKCSSFIVTDTKDVLYDNHAEDLKAAGYKVLKLDMVNSRNSCSYNPLDFIGYNEETGRYNEQDIVTLSEMLCPTDSEDEVFFFLFAQMFISALIGFLLETTDKVDHDFKNLVMLYTACCNMSTMDSLFTELQQKNPMSFAARRYNMFKSVGKAEKCYSSIMMFVANAFNGFDCSETDYIFNNSSSFTFEELANSKTALFINVSDSDRSMDKIVNILYAQAFKGLISYADSLPEKRLPVPIRLVLDDFATNTVIPKFSKLISVIRSREISVSVILQNLSQLHEIYSEPESNTIISNCDHMLFLGTTDVSTAKIIGEKMNAPYYKILNMPLDYAYVFESGNEKGGIKVDKYIPEFMEVNKQKV